MPVTPPQVAYRSTILDISDIHRVTLCKIAHKKHPTLRIRLSKFSALSELAKTDAQLADEQRWGPMHFIFRGAPFQAYREVGRLLEESGALKGRAAQLEKQMKEGAEQHQKAINALLERQQRVMQEASQKAIRMGTGIAKIEG